MLNGSMINERASLAINGYRNDLYNHGVHIFYLLKNETASNSWSRFDLAGPDGMSVTGGEVVGGSSSSGYFAQLFEVVPAAGNSWDLGGKKWPTAGLTDQWSDAPCRSNCPLFSPNGDFMGHEELYSMVAGLRAQVQDMKMALHNISASNSTTLEEIEEEECTDNAPEPSIPAKVGDASHPEQLNSENVDAQENPPRGNLEERTESEHGI